MAHIDYYFSTLSPFAYLAGMELEEIAHHHGATIAYKPLDIMTLFARTGGVAPKDRHPNRAAYRLQELRRGGVKAGVPITLKPAFFPTNAAPSSYAIIAAANAAGTGNVGKLTYSILQAVWAEDKDIAEDSVIKACLSAAGFDPSLADSGLLLGAETYAKNLEEAIDAGVFGSPSYRVGEELFWGHDRLDDLDAHLSGDL